MSDVQDPDARSALDVVDRQVRHQTRLVDDLLDVSRVSRGRIALAQRDVDLREVAEHAGNLFRERAARVGLELDVSLDDEPLMVVGDLTRLEQIASNLVTNAVKYTPAGGHVAVSAHREGDRAVLRVVDDGIGIQPQGLERIFDLFTQEDTSLDRSAGGLGIGLTLVRRLVELHGGTVRAHSEGRGKGTEMVVDLPLAPPAAAAGEAEAAVDVPPARTVQLRILVVEDNADSRVLTCRMLERWGHQVTVAADGESGVQAALAEPPDVALVDIGLPTIDGFEVARRLRDHPETRQTRLVAVTGYTQPEDQRKARKAGFDELLAKPVDPQRLLRLLGGIGRSSPPPEQPQAD